MISIWLWNLFQPSHPSNQILNHKWKSYFPMEKLLSEGLLGSHNLFPIALDLILKPSHVSKSDTEKEKRAWILFESSGKYFLLNTKWENIWNKIWNTEAIHTWAFPILSFIYGSDLLIDHQDSQNWGHTNLALCLKDLFVSGFQQNGF